jgi:hypothetical protein
LEHETFKIFRELAVHDLRVISLARIPCQPGSGGEKFVVKETTKGNFQ